MAAGRLELSALMSLNGLRAQLEAPEEGDPSETQNALHLRKCIRALSYAVPHRASESLPASKVLLENLSYACGNGHEPAALLEKFGKAMMAADAAQTAKPSSAPPLKAGKRAKKKIKQIVPRQPSE